MLQPSVALFSGDSEEDGPSRYGSWVTSETRFSPFAIYDECSEHKGREMSLSFRLGDLIVPVSKGGTDCG